MTSKLGQLFIGKALKSHDGPIYGVALYLVLSVLGLNPWLTLLPLAAAGVWLGFLEEEPLEALTEECNVGAMHISVALFALSFVLSTLCSDDVSTSLNALVGIIPGFLIYYILVASKSAKKGQIIGLGILGLQLAAAMMLIPGFLSTPDGGLSGSLKLLSNRVFVVPNDVVIIAILLPFTVQILTKSKMGMKEMKLSRTVELLLACLALFLSISMLVLAESRLAILGLLLIVLWLLYVRWGTGLFLLICTLLTMGLIYLFSAETLRDNMLMDFLLNERLSVWYIGVGAYPDNPVLGAGPGVFGEIYREVMIDSEMPEWMPLDGRIIPWAHSLYVEALVERGIIGFLALLACLYYAFHQRLQRAKTQPFQKLFSGFGDVIVVSLFIFVVCAALELTMQRTWVPTIFLLLLGLCMGQVAEPQSRKDHFSG